MNKQHYHYHGGAYEEEFRPVPMGKATLAHRYFPDCSGVAARFRLMRWIRRCRPLTEALARTGYRPSQRLLSAAQVRLIAEYLGEP